MSRWCCSLLLAVLVCMALLHAGAVAAAPLPDPTRPPQQFRQPAAGGPQAKGDWRLGSVLIGSQRRVAVIDGRPVTVGDRLNGARIVVIEPGRVRLRRGSEEIVLRLLPAGPSRRAVAERK